MNWLLPSVLAVLCPYPSRFASAQCGSATHAPTHEARSHHLICICPYAFVSLRHPGLTLPIQAHTYLGAHLLLLSWKTEVLEYSESIKHESQVTLCVLFHLCAYEYMGFQESERKTVEFVYIVHSCSNGLLRV